MKRTPPRKTRSAQDRDPLFNQSVEKAFAILEAFGGERRALNLTEVATAVGMTKSSAQRCTHTLERLGYLRRDPHMRRWVLTPKSLSMAHSYLSGHPLIEQATTHLIDLNQASGESVSLSEPYETDMVFIARFPSHKRFFIHMPVGRRLPMYCTASGRAYLSGLPTAEVQKILRRGPLKQYTPQTLTDPAEILKQVDAAREAGYAWADQEYYRGDVTIAAPVFGDDGSPVAAVNISGPSSRWSLADLRSKLSSVLMETARACSSGTVARMRA
jgi:IclR family transcriptional regulator, pca regulon regulatory protein